MAHIGRINVPLLIIHGLQDSVIPPVHRMRCSTPRKSRKNTWNSSTADTTTCLTSERWNSPAVFGQTACWQMAMMVQAEAVFLPLSRKIQGPGSKLNPPFDAISRPPLSWRQWPTLSHLVRPRILSLRKAVLPQARAQSENCGGLGTNSVRPPADTVGLAG